MKINVGCGARVLDGWFNCDAVRHPNAPRDPELLCLADNIPLDTECADELMAIHVFEHFYRWDCDKVINEWKRLLRPGGLLVLELPNIIKCCQNVLDRIHKGGKELDQLGMWGLYGDPRLEDQYMVHRWAWSPNTLRVFLASHGFVKIVEKTTVFHPAGRMHRDMRLEARRP